MARLPQIALDRDRVRAAIRALPAEYVRYMLPDAVELLAGQAARRCPAVDLRRLRPDSKKARANLLADVKAFEHASLAGDFYESFEVNSRNFMELSRGTTHWIEFRGLLGVCVKQARKGNAARPVRPSVSCSGLLARLDEGRDDVVFFADEGAPLVGLIGKRCSRRGSSSCQQRHRQISTRAESPACSSATAATRLTGCLSWHGRSRRRRNDRPSIAFVEPVERDDEARGPRPSGSEGAPTGARSASCEEQRRRRPAMDRAQGRPSRRRDSVHSAARRQAGHSHRDDRPAAAVLGRERRRVDAGSGGPAGDAARGGWRSATRQRRGDRGELCRGLAGPLRDHKVGFRLQRQRVRPRHDDSGVPDRQIIQPIAEVFGC